MQIRIVLAAALCAAACGGSSQTDHTGTLTVTLTQAPPDALCVQLTATGATRSVTRSFNLAAGQSTVSLAMNGIPTGNVLLSGSAYNSGCSLTLDTPSWVVVPQQVTVPGSATLVLVRNGQESLGLNFQDDQRAVTTLVGSGLSNPFAAIADNAGHLLVADTGNNAIKQVTIATKAVTTVASGSPLIGPGGLARDASGNIYVVNGACNIVKITGGVATVFAGSTLGCTGFASDGVGTAARFYAPLACVVVTTGSASYLYVTDHNSIRQIVLSGGTVGQVTTVAGTYLSGSADGSGAAATFFGLNGIAADASNLYVTDRGTIRQITLSGFNVTTIEGTAGGNSEVDALGADAGFSVPAGIAADGAGNLFVSDQGGNTVRRVVLASSAVVTIAGTAGSAGTADGAGSAARFNAPSLLGIDSAGVLYLADQGNNSIRAIAAP